MIDYDALQRVIDERNALKAENERWQADCATARAERDAAHMLLATRIEDIKAVLLQDAPVSHCIHCGEIVAQGEDHWRECELHPARAEVERLTEDLRCARAEVDDNRCAMRSVREAHQEVERLRGKLAALADAGTGYSQQTVDALSKERDTLAKEAERLRIVAGRYADHDNNCAVNQYEAGRPTADGGYEMRYAGVWYERRPVDRTPPCTCGFDAALAACEEGR